MRSIKSTPVNSLPNGATLILAVALPGGGKTLWFRTGRGHFRRWTRAPGRKVWSEQLNFSEELSSLLRKAHQRFGHDRRRLHAVLTFTLDTLETDQEPDSTH